MKVVRKDLTRLLLTGFEPFDGDSINPSLEIVRAMAGRALVAELPVDRDKAVTAALAAVEATRPDVVILLGLWAGRSRICLERVAINVDDFRIPDNAGNQPRGTPIVEGGPVGYFSTLPVYLMRNRLAEAGIPVAISNTAGTYLCNRVFYSVMHHLAVGPSSVLAGFIHLPLLHEQAVAKDSDLPSLSREVMVEAVELAAASALDHWDLSFATHPHHAKQKPRRHTRKSGSGASLK